MDTPERLVCVQKDTGKLVSIFKKDFRKEYHEYRDAKEAPEAEAHACPEEGCDKEAKSKAGLAAHSRSHEAKEAKEECKEEEKCEEKVEEAPAETKSE